MDDIEKAVDDLFTNGSGQKADRLVLMVDSTPKHDLGGLSRGAVVDRLRAAAVPPPPREEPAKCLKCGAILMTRIGCENCREDASPR